MSLLHCRSAGLQGCRGAIVSESMRESAIVCDSLGHTESSGCQSGLLTGSSGSQAAQVAEAGRKLPAADSDWATTV